jgi:V8-like Glu-specific endopeptidase
MMRLALGVAPLFLIGAPALAQTADIPQRRVAYQAQSGIHSATESADAALVWREVVQSAGAPWVRLHTSSFNLGSGSYVTVTSVEDGALQLFDADSLAEWQGSTAYFNGDAVEVALYVTSGDQSVFVNIGHLTVGEVPAGAQESQCGPADNRTSSNDPKVCRVMSVGCTGWLVTGGWFVTAGHCLTSAGSVDVAQFNVPPSAANGSVRHPGPEDQYSIITGTREFSSGGVGNDWGVYETNTNSTTGMTALQAQGASFSLVQNLGPATIRITGHGVDNGVDNQTQQTHTGPNAGSSGQTMRYRADTEGGNSGSPVINNANGTAVGVHTHGGCTGGGGNNSGTSLFHAAFFDAATNGPSGTTGPCPSIVALGESASSAMDLSVLRSFRDDILAVHPATQPYVDLFYTHAAEISGILLVKGDLRNSTTLMLRELVPGIRSTLNGRGGRFVLTTGRMWRIQLLLNRIAANGSPELKQALRGLQGDVLQLWGKSLKEILIILRAQTADDE